MSAYRAVLVELQKHHYRASKPHGPGWYFCSCGWEGYWRDWQPHVADRIAAVLAPIAACTVVPATCSSVLCEDVDCHDPRHRRPAASAEAGESRD